MDGGAGSTAPAPPAVAASPPAAGGRPAAWPLSPSLSVVSLEGASDGSGGNAARRRLAGGGDAGGGVRRGEGGGGRIAHGGTVAGGAEVGGSDGTEESVGSTRSEESLLTVEGGSASGGGSGRVSGGGSSSGSGSGDDNGDEGASSGSGARPASPPPPPLQPDEAATASLFDPTPSLFSLPALPPLAVLGMVGSAAGGSPGGADGGILYEAAAAELAAAEAASVAATADFTAAATAAAAVEARLDDRPRVVAAPLLSRLASVFRRRPRTAIVAPPPVPPPVPPPPPPRRLRGGARGPFRARDAGGSFDEGGAGRSTTGYDARYSVGVVESASGPTGRAYVYGDYTERVPDGMGTAFTVLGTAEVAAAAATSTRATAMPWVDGGLRGRGGETDAHEAGGADTLAEWTPGHPPLVAARGRRRHRRSDTGVLHPSGAAAAGASRGRRTPADGARGGRDSERSSASLADSWPPHAAVDGGGNGNSSDSGDGEVAAAAVSTADSWALEERGGSASWDEAANALGGWASPGWAPPHWEERAHPALVQTSLPNVDGSGGGVDGARPLWWPRRLVARCRRRRLRRPVSSAGGSAYDALGAQFWSADAFDSSAHGSPSPGATGDGDGGSGGDGGTRRARAVLIEELDVVAPLAVARLAREQPAAATGGWPWAPPSAPVGGWGTGEGGGGGDGDAPSAQVAGATTVPGDGADGPWRGGWDSSWGLPPTAAVAAASREAGAAAAVPPSPPPRHVCAFRSDSPLCATAGCGAPRILRLPRAAEVPATSAVGDGGGGGGGGGASPTPQAVDARRTSVTCTVCLEDIRAGEWIRRLHCEHAYHAACIEAWTRRSTDCPICRADVAAGPVWSAADAGDGPDDDGAPPPPPLPARYGGRRRGRAPGGGSDGVVAPAGGSVGSVGWAGWRTGAATGVPPLERPAPSAGGAAGVPTAGARAVSVRTAVRVGGAWPQVGREGARGGAGAGAFEVAEEGGGARRRHRWGSVA